MGLPKSRCLRVPPNGVADGAEGQRPRIARLWDARIKKSGSEGTPNPPMSWPGLTWPSIYKRHHGWPARRQAMTNVGAEALSLALITMAALIKTSCNLLRPLLA
jgi:hypothetical protein